MVYSMPSPCPEKMLEVASGKACRYEGSPDTALIFDHKSVCIVLWTMYAQCLPFHRAKGNDRKNP